jgi:hypothetical protein
LRNQAPVDGVAERLVDAGAVLIDGDADGGTHHRRCHEPAVADVGLKGVVLDFVDIDARETAEHKPAHRLALQTIHVLRVGGLIVALWYLSRLKYALIA